MSISLLSVTGITGAWQGADMDNIKKYLAEGLSGVVYISSAIYLLIAFALAVLALFSFYDVLVCMSGLFTAVDPTLAVLETLHALLLTLIIVEVLETVTAYFRTNRVQVRPILIAGLTAMVRRILLFGVETTAPADIAVTLAAIIVLTIAVYYVGEEECGE